MSSAQQPQKKKKISPASWASIVIILAFIIGFLVVFLNPHTQDPLQPLAGGMIYMVIAIVLCLVVHWIRVGRAASKRRRERRALTREYKAEQARNEQEKAAAKAKEQPSSQ